MIRDELALQCSQMRARPKPLERNISSVANWLVNKGNAIASAETLYLDQDDDLFPLAPRSASPLRRLLERSRRFRTLSYWRTNPRDTNLSTGFDEGVHYRSDGRIDRFVNVLILVLGTSMLITPLWILEFVSETVDRLGVITIFIVIFLGFVAFTSPAKSFETLAATAAYSAILMVFLQTAGK